VRERQNKHDIVSVLEKKIRTLSRERQKRGEIRETEGGYSVNSSEDNNNTNHVIGQAT
jgi:hypothetical protein